jgi:hypothetical protein
MVNTNGDSVYVGIMWNTYRKAMVLLLDLIARVAKHLSHDGIIAELEDRALVLVSDMVASVPYFLAANANEYIRLVEAGSASIPSNRPVGGLLLLHPLYAVANCTIIPTPIRQYFSNCLAWIGQNMGIGQADLFAKSIRTGIEDHTTHSRKLSLQRMHEGHVLVWAGMLLQPA